MTNSNDMNTLQNEISKLRQKILDKKEDVQSLQSALDGLLAVQKVQENKLSSEPRQLLQE